MARPLVLAVGAGASLTSAYSWQVHTAPMQGYTSLPLRTMFGFLCPPQPPSSPFLHWTEMEKVHDLINADQDGWARRFGSPNQDTNHRPILQLGGSDPILLEECLRKASSLGYGPEHFSGVNLNCGCPSIESGGAATYGASLMRRPELTGELVSTVKQTLSDIWGNEGHDVEVSVKTRIAAFDTPDDLILGDDPSQEWHLSEKDYSLLDNYLKQIQDGGADHVILHARPAILSGLSPVKNRIVPKLDYTTVDRAARDFPGMRVTLNGGIGSLSDLDLVTNKAKFKSGEDQPIVTIASVMVGRWMLRRPLDLASICMHYLGSDEATIENSVDNITIRAVEKYIDYIQRALLDKSGVVPATAELLLPLYLVVEQLREDYDSYDEDSDVLLCPSLALETIETIYQMIVNVLLHVEDMSISGGGGLKKSKIPSKNAVNFKRLAASFKGGVGSKVVNKWKRNRGEL